MFDLCSMFRFLLSSSLKDAFSFISAMGFLLLHTHLISHLLLNGCIFLNFSSRSRSLESELVPEQELESVPKLAAMDSRPEPGSESEPGPLKYATDGC